jgi:hypothetical protein
VAALRNEAAHSNYKISNKKVRKKWHRILVGNTRSAEMINIMHGSLAKTCIILIVSVDLAFWTLITWCYFLGLKLDETGQIRQNIFGHACFVALN